MGVRLWHVCSWCARWRILRHGDFVTILQLRNECRGLRNGSHVPKGGFAAAKHPSKWRIDCEMEDFKAWRFRSCEMDVRGCETISQQGGDFRSRSILATKFRRPCSLLAFELLLIPNFLLSPLLTFLLILIIRKPMLHQNKLELKHWNQNLKHEIKIKTSKQQNKKIWTS